MKLSKDAVVTKCGECNKFYKAIGIVPTCRELDKQVNPETLCPDCPLPDCEVIEIKNSGKNAPSMDFIEATLKRWNDIDKIIIVKKGAV